MWDVYKWSPVAYKHSLTHYGRDSKVVSKVTFLGCGMLYTEILKVRLKCLHARSMLPVSLNNVILSFHFNLYFTLGSVLSVL